MAATKVHGNKGRAVKRKPVRSAIPAVRQMFEILDASGLPYAVMTGTSRDNLCRWRFGHRGPHLDMFTEVAYNMGYDVVLVPRAGGHTPATPQPVDGTHSGVATAPATAGRAA